MVGIILISLICIALLCAVMAVQSLKAEAKEEAARKQANGKQMRVVSQAALQRLSERDAMLEAIIEQRKPSYLGALSKDLSVAGWQIKPAAFMEIQLGTSLLGILPLFVGGTVFSALSVAILCPLVVSTTLRWQVKRRLKRFNNDYYAFLLVFVSLVRVGMNVVSAIAEATKGLPEDSLVKEEMDAVLKALNLGMPERDAFSLLGQRFYHQHLISFRNAIIVNRRFGGSLSDAVMRIALQSRKQHHLYDKVDSAISMERGSVWLVTFVMLALFVFLTYTNPDFLAGGDDTVSRHIYEIGVLMISLGFIVMQRISHIRV